ncbi:hypothetical protein Dimus_037995 [Dionaea muscipula]
MYVSPGFMSVKLTACEKQRLENIKNNRMQLLAAGIDLPRMKSMGDDLFGSKRKSNVKSSKEGKNKVGYGADDEEYLPHDGEDSAHFYSADDDESGRAHTTKEHTIMDFRQPLIDSYVEEMHVPVAPPSSTQPIEENNEHSSPFNVEASIVDVEGNMGAISILSKKRKKRVRGPTRGFKVDKLRKTLGHPIPIQIDRERIAIVGGFATFVANTIGENIRQNAPIRDIGWQEIDFGIRESIILRAGQTFELGDYKNDMVIRHILDVKCQILYTNWKCKLHRYYQKMKKDVSDPENHPLAPCNQDDWVFMIKKVWRKKAFKKKSKRGKNARKGLQYNHTSGSQSFVARASKFATTEKKSNLF